MSDARAPPAEAQPIDTVPFCTSASTAGSIAGRTPGDPSCPDYSAVHQRQCGQVPSASDLQALARSSVTLSCTRGTQCDTEEKAPNNAQPLYQCYVY